MQRFPSEVCLCVRVYVCVCAARALDRLVVDIRGRKLASLHNSLDEVKSDASGGNNLSTGVDPWLSQA